MNGSHGVTRPGGTGTERRAGRRIPGFGVHAAKYRENTFPETEFDAAAEKVLAVLNALRSVPAKLDWREERAALQHRMSESGAFVRSSGKVVEALDGVYRSLHRLNADGLGAWTRSPLPKIAERPALHRQIFYLESILMQIDYIGSRGGSIVLSEKGSHIHPALNEKWRMAEEKTSFRRQIMMCGYGANGYPEISWCDCRPIPETDGWFETVWSDCRTGKIYGEDA